MQGRILQLARLDSYPYVVDYPIIHWIYQRSGVRDIVPMIVNI